MNLVWKLLRQHISVPQFVGFFFANLVGMTIIILGIQFYTDTRAIFNEEDSFMKPGYLIINKKISSINTITGKSGAFSLSDIQDLQRQEFVKKTGTFTSSSFDVRATFNLDETTNISTDMFFESVEDEFVDVKTDDWTYTIGERELPIILPRSYLDLYNFGYAQSRNMPKLSEGILGVIRLQIDIRGNGKQDTYVGRIAGFSSRLNTILVPQTFMDWANRQYAGDKPKEATRLIVEVDNPTDDRITGYLQDHNYETDEDKLDASRQSFMLKVIVAIVMSVGLVICVLSIYILMLSVYLLVEKNNTKLENLLLIGYSPRRVSMPYQVLTIGLNVAVLVIAFALLVVVRSQYLALFESFFPNFETPTMTYSLVSGVALLIIVSIINTIAIKSKVMSIWKRKD